MEFGEKLQQLRKEKGMTQEELAQCLYVSRTAVSKWESGRGYPSIDSLKAVSAFFSVSLDDLLSAERVLDIAQDESKKTFQKLLDRLFALADMGAVLLVLLPLYPKPVAGMVYSVNLIACAAAGRTAFFVLYLMMILLGAGKWILTQMGKDQRAVTLASMAVGILSVFLLGLTRQPYAGMLAFVLLIGKTTLLFLKK